MSPVAGVKVMAWLDIQPGSLTSLPGDDLFELMQSALLAACVRFGDLALRQAWRCEEGTGHGRGTASGQREAGPHVF